MTRSEYLGFDEPTSGALDTFKVTVLLEREYSFDPDEVLFLLGPVVLARFLAEERDVMDNAAVINAADALPPA